MYWVGKTIARDMSKVYVQDGTFKNGKPKMTVRYICAECERQGLNVTHALEDSQMDHIHPVVDVKGFTNWDDYINSLFCSPAGYQTLCRQHHLEKSQKENQQRWKEKSKKKLTKSKK